MGIGGVIEGYQPRIMSGKRREGKRMSKEGEGQGERQKKKEGNQEKRWVYIKRKKKRKVEKDG